MSELTIPTTVAFQKRLAELVWENCPDLARQTAAGKMALALDLDSSAVAGAVMDALVRDAIAEFRPGLMKKVKPLVDGEIPKVLDRLRSSVLTTIENSSHMEKEINRVLDETLRRRIERAADDCVGTSFGSMVEAKVKEVVAERVEDRLASDLVAQLAIDGGNLDLSSEPSVPDKSLSGL